MKKRFIGLASVYMLIPAMLFAQPAGKKQLVGVWAVKEAPVEQSQSPLLSLAMFGGDGSFTTASGYKALPPVPAVENVATELRPGYGRWAATNNAGELRLIYYSVMRKAGLVNGFQRVQDTLVLSESGDEYTGRAEVDFFDANWNLVFSNTSDVKGTRLEIPAGLAAQAAETRGVWEIKLQRFGISGPPLLGLILFGEDGSFTADIPRPVPSAPAIQAVANEIGPSYGRVVQTDDPGYRTVLYIYAVMWKAGLVNGFVRAQAQANEVLSESRDEFTSRAHADYLDANWNVRLSFTNYAKYTRLETPGQD